MVASEDSDQWSGGAYAPFHGSSNENIGGLGRIRRLELLPFWFELIVTFRALDTLLSSYSGVLFLKWMQFKVLHKEQTWSSIQFIAGEEFIGGVVDTGEQFIAGVISKFPNVKQKSGGQTTLHSVVGIYQSLN